jgi:hypothetical protein
MDADEADEAIEPSSASRTPPDGEFGTRPTTAVLR